MNFSEEEEDDGPTLSADEIQLQQTLLARLKELEPLKGTEHPQTLLTIVEIATFKMKTRQLRDAEQMYERAYVGHGRAHGKEHAGIFIIATNYAVVLLEMRKYADAEFYFRRALGGFGKHPADWYDDALVVAMSGLGEVLFIKKEFARSEEYFKKVLELRQKHYGKEHPDTLHAVNNVAKSLNAQNKVLEALSTCEDSFEACLKVFGRDHPITLAAIEGLAFVFQAQRRDKKAMDLYRMAYQGNQAILGHDHPATIASITKIAKLLHEQNDVVGAEEAFRISLGLSEGASCYGPSHPFTYSIVHNIGDLLQQQDRVVEAEGVLRRAVTGRTKELGSDHPDTLHSCHLLANVLCVLSLWKHNANWEEKQRESVALYKSTLLGRSNTLTDLHPDTILTRSEYGSLLIDCGPSSLREATRMFENILKSHTTLYGLKSEITAESAYKVGVLLQKQALHKKAVRLYEISHKCYLDSLGEDHRQTEDAAELYRNAVFRANL